MEKVQIIAENKTSSIGSRIIMHKNRRSIKGEDFQKKKVNRDSPQSYYETKVLSASYQ